LSVCVVALSAAPARGQSPTLTSVPLVLVTSSFHPADGQPPAPVETMTLSIYREKTGGVPLWHERQMVAVNPDGRFTLLIGSTRPEGLPLDLFASGEPRWLAVHVERPGEGEAGRVLLASEPALRASDAKTLGARPASAHVPASTNKFVSKFISSPAAVMNTDVGAGAAENVPAAKTGDAPMKGAAEAGSAVSQEEMLSTIKRLAMRVEELENKLDKGTTNATPSVAQENAVKEADSTPSVAVKAVKEDAVGQGTINPVATATNTNVGAKAPPNPTGAASAEAAPATKQDLSWTKGAFKVELFGRAQLDVIYNSTRPLAPGTPFLLLPKFPGGFTNPTIDINARQSMVGVLFTGPKIGSFQTGGRISAVFFDPTVVADRNGFLLQQSYGELFNDQWRFAAGLQFDVFAPGLPTLLPFSYLGGSGSPGNCIRGQIRVERFVNMGSDSQLTLQGALSEPRNSVITPGVLLDEDNGKPNVEGRIAFGLGKAAPIGLLRQRPIEVGVSGLVGQLRRTAPPTDPPRRVVSDVWGAAVDFRVNLASRYGFMGEVYAGQALGNYNGGILQSLDAETWRAIRSKGGFVEGYVYLTRYLHSHTGFGLDDPNNNDLTVATAQTYNSTFYSNLLWDLGGETKAFRIGLEFTYRQTDYKQGSLSNKGFGVQPQFRWTF